MPEALVSIKVDMHLFPHEEIFLQLLVTGGLMKKKKKNSRLLF